MDTLIGRHQELATLDGHVAAAVAGRPQLVVMFGRRRVGKTFLLNHWRRRLDTSIPAAYYPATRESSGAQRSALVTRLAAAGIEGVEQSDSWDQILFAMFDAARTSARVVVIDEAPYLVESDGAWPSILQHRWDAEQSHASPSKLVLVLNGSAISSMTSMVASNGALYGRTSQQLRIEPFDVSMAHELLGKPGASTTTEAYAACGGYPLLLSQWDIESDALDNLVRLAGAPLGPLAEHARTLLLDIGDTRGNHAVLGAVGRGATKLAEINNRAGLKADRPLDVLDQAGFVGRRTPIGEPPRKNIRYDLLDGYLRFWFAIVDRNIQLIESGQGAEVIRASLPLWTQQVADTFERIARRHTAELVANGTLPRLLVGEWWTDSGTQAQVDVVGLDGKHWGLAGEVKWSETFGRADLGQLERNIERAGRSDDRPMLASWSRSGPTRDVAALRNEMLHFTVDDIVR